MASMLDVIAAIDRSVRFASIGSAGAEAQNPFVQDRRPSPGVAVEVLVSIGQRQHLLPFLVNWSDEGWVVAGSRRLLAFDVIGWRSPKSKGRDASTSADKGSEPA